MVWEDHNGIHTSVASSQEGMNHTVCTVLILPSEYGCTGVEEEEMAGCQRDANTIRKKARTSNASSSSSDTLLPVCSWEVRVASLENDVMSLRNDVATLRNDAANLKAKIGRAHV